MKMKKYILIATCCILSLGVYSQINEGGLPPSFKYQRMLRSAITEYKADVNMDVDRLTWEDDVAGKNGSPLRIAQAIPVNINIKNTGEWSFLPDSTKIWQQSVTASNARGVIISYTDFYIPVGGKLFIYNKDKSQVLGAYTNKTNPEGGSFATEAIAGDSFTFEYVASKNSSEEPRIEVESLGYMYRLSPSEVGAPDPVINTPHPEAGRRSCRVNVNCPAGAKWQKQKRGVVLYYIMLGNSWFACTGSLVNNTKQDGKPYILTASHCFTIAPSYKKLVAYFNYEFPGCENQNSLPANYKTLVGAVPRVHVPLDGGSDNFLIEMTENIPANWNPYYNGWNRQNNPANNGVVIHHPNKDVKKIITYNKAVKHGTYSWENGAQNGFWEVVYDGTSVSEKGSSGSPLFNENGLIIGVLTGGNSYCELPENPDFFGKLWFGWDQFNKDIGFDHKLQPYLDPMNTGALTLEGYDPNGHSGIEEEFNYPENKDLVLFPNPVENELNINTASIIKNIKIYNIQGRLMSTFNVRNSSTAVINMEGWNKGTYTITVETESKKLSDKILKR